MDIFAETDYKRAIRNRLKALRKRKKTLTLQRLAQQVPIHYTHLSRVLAGEDKHLSEAHLFRIGCLLDLYPDEIDFLLLLRGCAVATETEWQDHLSRRIAKIRQARGLNAPMEEFRHERIATEMAYLFEPAAVQVHVSLTIDDYLKNPRALCSKLGLTPKRLGEILQRLAELGFLELGEDGVTPRKMLKGKLHYGTDHPLMRVHQSLLRDASAAKLQTLSDEEKHSLMVTFSSEASAVATIRERFQRFLRDAEALAAASPRRQCYQMNFDLFPWF